MKGTTLTLIIMVATITATRGMGTGFMSITNFESIMAEDSNTTAVEDLSTVVEDPTTLHIQGMVAGMSRITEASTEQALGNTIRQ